MFDLNGYKIIRYTKSGLKSDKKSEDLASWYLTSNIDLNFISKRNIKNIKLGIEFSIIKDGNIEKTYSISNQNYFLTIPNKEFDAIVVTCFFENDANYSCIALNCEDIKFAYEFYRDFKRYSKFELGSFVPYKKEYGTSYRFFPCTHFMK